MISGIYGWLNISNNKWLVGSSNDIKGRKNFHLNYLRKNKHWNPHFQSAFNLYGIGIFEFRILEECEENMLLIREQHWIDYYDSMNPEKGYNLQNANRTVKSKESYKKTSIGLKKWYATHDKKQPQEVKDRISKSLMGHKNSPIKPIEQLTLDGILVKKFNSITEARDVCDSGHISSVCKGKRLTASGYKWRYV